MRCRAFTLIEMLISSTLVAILMAGVLVLLGGITRDVQSMSRHAQADYSNLMRLLIRDAGNSAQMLQRDDGRLIEFVGNIGIDRRSLSADGRLARVRYQIGDRHELRQEQIYLDTPERPQPWSEIAAAGVESLSIISPSGDSSTIRLSINSGGVNYTRVTRIR